MKKYIVYNKVWNYYVVMSEKRKNRIEKEFWISTTDWKVYEYSESLEKFMKDNWFCLIKDIDFNLMKIFFDCVKEKENLVKIIAYKSEGVVSYKNWTYHLIRDWEIFLIKTKWKKIKFLKNRLNDWKETDWEDYNYVEYNEEIF